MSYLHWFDQCHINMSTIAIEFVLADLPSKTNAFTRIKHESKQVSNTLTTYIPCHNTSPPKHQSIKDSADESILHYVEKMKIESKVWTAHSFHHFKTFVLIKWPNRHIYKPIGKTDGAINGTAQAPAIQSTGSRPEKKKERSFTISLLLGRQAQTKILRILRILQIICTYTYTAL